MTTKKTKRTTKEQQKPPQRKQPPQRKKGVSQKKEVYHGMLNLQKNNKRSNRNSGK